MMAAKRARRAFRVLALAACLLSAGSAPPGLSSQALAAELDDEVLRVYRADPARGEQAFEKAWRGALEREEWARLHRLLDGAAGIATSDALAAARRKARVQALESAPALRPAVGHPMKYYLSLPRGWKREGTWPIAVSVDGRLSAFARNAATFHRARGDLPFILVTPVTLSNTNAVTEQQYGTYYPLTLIEEMKAADFQKRLEFDVAGLRTVLVSVRAEFGGADKAYITGWSGGGNLTWAMVVAYPDELAAAATAGGNFFPQLATIHGISTSPARVSLPVRAFQGTEDKYLDQYLLPQWVQAKFFTEQHGFGDVRLRWRVGQAHGIFPGPILKFFDAVRNGQADPDEAPPPIPEAPALARLDPATAKDAPQLVSVGGHAMRYWVSLPRAWRPSAAWPVLVTVEGSAGDFEGNIRALAQKREELPFILVAPVALSNAALLTRERYPYPTELLEAMNRSHMKERLRFDLDGLLLALDEVRHGLGGSEKVFLTGYAGGGNLTWAMTFAHPERLAAVAPVSGCFWGPFDEVAPAEQRAALEVRGFQGMHTTGPMNAISDEHWANAKRMTDRIGGFASVSRVALEAPHGRKPDAALEFFASKLPSAARSAGSIGSGAGEAPIPR